ncbi:MAG: hypothetical protein A2W61_03795 [Deltaproteobacteria bacterium RIFCSPLOWO2_01_44_7]|nr:MAG: hypothetical protein A2W61_03795 [Deltaproteobacteria bacterium RIFCSPLOWO2_01_44_7]
MIIEIVGWIGSVLVLLAYILVSNKKMSATSYWYQGFNCVGSVGLIINTFYNQAWPSCVLNIIWAMIAIKALIDIRRPTPTVPLDR